MKQFIYNILIFAGLFSLASCDDYLTLYPEDDIVDNEYWVDGTKVQSVVAAAYRYMADNNTMRKMLYWGELRSDNVDYVTGGTDEENLHNANLLSSSSLVKWDGFYKVINICNNVISKAPPVRDIDVNFTEEKLNAYMAEAYTLRALCYFYLVRSFGDVPYVTEPSDSEQKDYMVTQMPAGEIIDNLISDMEQYAVKWAAQDWETEEYTHGRITVNAVRALLADLYLWRASDISNTTSDADYQQCIDYCDAILNDENSTLIFAEDNIYSTVFYQGNASENIFELNFVNDGLPNNSTAQLYGNVSKGIASHFTPTQNLYSKFTENDSRRYQYLQLNYTGSGTNMAVSSYRIFKYEGMRPASDYGATDFTYRAANNYANWIIYRLSEIYLIKAEALAVLAQHEGSLQKAEEAIRLCNVIHNRYTPAVQDELTIGQISDAENVVLDERRMELCFEGKRWYDLLRKVRREGSTDKALQWLVSARSGDTQLFEARLQSVDAWYLPISKTEMNANPNLHQNTYYKLKEQ